MRLVRDVGGVSFSDGIMYAKFRCGYCNLEKYVQVAKYRVTHLQRACRCRRASWKELGRRARGTSIEVDRRCGSCGREWTEKIEWYDGADGLSFD